MTKRPAVSAVAGFLALLSVACSDALTPASPSGDVPLTTAFNATSIKIPFTQTAFVPCAAGGAGEDVLITGVLHILTRLTFDNAGGVHMGFHFQPQGARGVGQTTGDIYRGGGVTQQSLNINASGLPLTDTFVNNFHLVGPGRSNNLLVHDNVHVTINENGDLTASVDHSTVECR